MNSLLGDDVDPFEEPRFRHEREPGPQRSFSYYLLIGPDNREIRVPASTYLRLSAFVGELSLKNPHAYRRIADTLRVVSRTGTIARFYHDPTISGVAGYWLLADCPRFPNKYFAVFGDLHVDNRGLLCPPFEPGLYFPEMLSEVVKNTEGTVDLFLEFAYRRPGEEIVRRPPGGHMTLPDTRVFFWECLRADKTACRQRYPNLRLHYADYRESSSPEIKGILDIADTFRWLAERFAPEKSSGGTPPTPENLVMFGATANELLRRLPSGLADWKDWYRRVIRTTKIKKELDAIQDRETAQAIADFGESELEKAYSPDVVDKVRRYFESGARPGAPTVTMLMVSYAWLVHLLNPIMDVYLLARAFRRYRDPTDEARNVIIYAGMAHANNYATFLRLLGFHLLEGDQVSGSARGMQAGGLCLEAPSRQPYFMLPFTEPNS
ncbi:MAG: hypothetical protein ACYCOU_03435 [Sulfobacillus sp.]